MNIAAIVLAAGSSSRMGSPKQLLDIGGQPLLTRTIQCILQAGIDRVIVVLGANEEQHLQSIGSLAVEVVSNKTWDLGMGSSLKAGLGRVMLQNPHPECVILSVCDQPLLAPENIKALVSAYRQTNKGIIASAYSDVPGVPALFHNRYFPELAALPDNEGAKKIIIRHSEDTATVPFPGGSVDLDTRQDYERFLKERI